MFITNDRGCGREAPGPGWEEESRNVEAEPVDSPDCSCSSEREDCQHYQPRTSPVNIIGLNRHISLLSPL